MAYVPGELVKFSIDLHLFEFALSCGLPCEFSAANLAAYCPLNSTITD